MIRAITDKMIRKLVRSDSMARAGLSYFRNGRVSFVQIDIETKTASARVRGSGSNRYHTAVDFADDELFPATDTVCSCPVGYGCKHVAALLYALEQELQEPPRLKIAAGTEAAGIVSRDVGDWLARARRERQNALIETLSVCFVIEPKRTVKPPPRAKAQAASPGPCAPARFLMQIRAFWTADKARQWRVLQYYELQSHLIPFDPLAARLVARMTPAAQGGDFTADKTPAGPYGWQWLGEAAAAGLLRWKQQQGRQVRVASEVLTATLEWQTGDDGHSWLALTGLPDHLTVFAHDPPAWYDEDAGVIGQIDTGIAPDLAARLLAMPPIAAIDIPQIADDWTAITGNAIAPPTLGDMVRIAQVTPKPVLRFMIDPVDVREAHYRWQPSAWKPKPQRIAHLEFDYAGHRIAAPAPLGNMIVNTDGVRARIARDLAAEQAAVDRLTHTALIPLALVDGIRVKPKQAWDHALAADSGTYPQMLVNEISVLAGEGWLIEYAPDWPHRLEPLDTPPPGLEINPGAGDPDALAPDGIDWFDVELPALVAGRRVDILPALRQVLASEGQALLDRDDDFQVALTLDAGRCTAVALGTVRPLLMALLRLALADRAGGTLRVNRYDLGTVHDLGGDGVGWTSADALRRLAAALHDPDQMDYTPPAALMADLRGYQRTGAGWLGALHGAGLGGILADDMGLGKTLQAIAHILWVRAGQTAPARQAVLVVAPTSVLPNWQAELARFAPTLDCLLWHGLDRRAQEGALAGADIVLTSYPLLARDKALLTAAHYDLVVLDEAHVLKNPATVGFKAAAALKSRQTIALSGTPIENRLNDIWALASLTNPGLLGGFDTFRKTYRTPIEKQGDQAARTALARRLRPFMLRRTKDQVATELPPKTLIPERIDLTEAQARLYESQRLLMNQRVRDEIRRVGLLRSQIIVLDAMLKLRQICCDPTLLPGGQGEGVASAKRARLLEMVPELIGEGRRVIVFSQFTAMLDRISADLAGAGIAHEHLRGSTRDRAAPVRRFQAGEVPVILVSLKAGGAGVNLTAADTVILYDPWWNPAVEAQAIDRAHRIGQTRPVFVHRMIATGTIEEKILTLQDRKKDLADMLWSETGTVAGAGLDDADIAFLLG